MPIRPTENPEILNMRGLNLFHYSYSNCSMRIRPLLDEKGIPQYALFQRNNFPFEPYGNWIDYVARWQKRPAYVSAIGNHMPGSMELPY